MQGHIRRRGKRSWAVIIDIGRDIDGKRCQKWHSVKGTKREAEDKLTQLMSELRNGIYIENGRINVSEFLLKWLDDHIQCKVAPNTYENYRDIIKKYLIPKLGHLELSKLKPLHIQSFYAKALESGRLKGKGGGLSKQTVLHFHRVLKESLGQAVKWQLLAINPCNAVEPPKPDRFEMKALDSEASVTLLESIKASCVYLPTFFAVMTGLRRGELLALRWQDVELNNAMMHISQTLQHVDAGLIFRQPKTHRSRRAVAIPAMAVEILKQHKATQAERKLALGKAYEDNGLVFAKEDGSPWSPIAFTSAFRSIVKNKMKNPIRFHDLRHSHATQLLKEGIHPKVVSERLGHSSVGITLDIYSHVLPGMQEDAAQKIDIAFKTAINNQKK